MEGEHQDRVHYNGIPGSRGGYSGSPVVSKYGDLCGMVVGAVHQIDTPTTLPNLIEQRGVKVMPIGTVMFVLGEYVPK